MKELSRLEMRNALGGQILGLEGGCDTWCDVQGSPSQVGCYTNGTDPCRCIVQQNPCGPKTIIRT